MRCNVPVVVSETLSTGWIMRNNAELLVEPNNTLQLCDTIKSVLQKGKIDYGEQQSWDELGKDFETLLLKNMS
jgi:hypothetical protein